mmetsp:Transcript_8446/g.12278  ORF Transcript_8446/g.12278 Transcript_8446/m.12278 type:complete len:218 (-) Transcript_8446:73-726(-)
MIQLPASKYVWSLFCVSADWVWLVPPAGGSMTKVFHQEMVNFILKPQYRLVVAPWDEVGMAIPEAITAEVDGLTSFVKFNQSASLYESIMVYYGSETGTSLRFATRLSSDLGNSVVGPLPLDDIPLLLKSPIERRTLVLVVTSTFGKGNPPSYATKFLPKMQEIPNGSVMNCDYSVFALGNSAYTQSFASFGHDVYNALRRSGAAPVLSRTYSSDQI